MKKKYNNRHRGAVCRFAYEEGYQHGISDGAGEVIDKIKNAINEEHEARELRADETREPYSEGYRDAFDDAFLLIETITEDESAKRENSVKGGAGK